MTIKLTTEKFKELIFDYTEGTEWKFKGDNPAVIDFYTDWCGPCKIMAPVFEELSNEYMGLVDFYKANLDDNVMLAGEFQITSVPSILFIPMDRLPEMAVGALPKADLEDAIKRILVVQ